MSNQKPGWLSKLIDRLKALRKNPTFSKLLSIVSIIYPLLLIYFSRKEILNLDWKSFSHIFLICLGIYYVSMALQNLNWSLIVDGGLARFWLNSKVFYQTVLMKKLPGGVWHWLGRVSFYELNGGEEVSQISSSNFIEWLLLILAGLVGFLFTVNLWLGIAGLLVNLIVGTYLLNRQFANPKKSIFLTGLITLLYGICWLAGSLILHFLLIGVNSGLPVDFKSSAAKWCLSSAISMLFFFFPSGALIRDFSMGALLTKEFEPAKVLLVILQVRIVFLVADFIWSFLSLQFINLFKNDSATKAS